jgi:hypothetical protein
MSIADPLSALRVNSDTGLTHVEVASCRKEYGYNEVGSAPKIFRPRRATGSIINAVASSRKSERQAFVDRVSPSAYMSGIRIIDGLRPIFGRLCKRERQNAPGKFVDLIEIAVDCLRFDRARPVIEPGDHKDLSGVQLIPLADLRGTVHPKLLANIRLFKQLSETVLAHILSGPPRANYAPCGYSLKCV